MDTKYRCEKCGREMNIINYMINPVCMKCAEQNHKKITGVK